MRLLERRTLMSPPLEQPQALRVERIRSLDITQHRNDQPFRWTVPTVLSAIDAHEVGDFGASGVLAEAFGRDDRIAGCLRTRVQAIGSKNGLAFSIQSATGSASQRAKRIESWWFQLFTDAVLAQIARDMILVGVYVGRLHWLRTEAEWRPVRLERWRPSNVRWDPERERYVVRTFEDEIAIEPGDPNWVVVQPGGEASWMSGAVRALGLAYIMRGFNWRDWARFNERHGLPIIALSEPADADERNKRAFYAGIQKMGATGIIRLPQNAQGQGFKLDIIEAKDAAFATFNAFRKDLDTAIAVTLLGQNLTTEVEGGSYAAANVHDRVRQDFLVADVEVLSTALRDQVLQPWGRFNFANWRDEDCEWPTWDTSLPPDRLQETQAFAQIATAVQTFQSTGMPVDYAEMFRRVGVPMVKGRDPNTAAPPPPPPGPEPQTDRPGKQPAARLASGAQAALNRGFVSGQMYADDLVEQGAKAGAEAGAPFVDELMRIIDEGADYEAIREAVLTYYAGAEDPLAVRQVLERVLVLANLAGRAAVAEDL